LRKAFLLLLLFSGIIMILNFTGFSAENPLATSIGTLAKQLTSQFGIIEIRVAAVQGEQVYLNAGKKKFIRLNTVYEIVDESKVAVKDPVTKANIGFLETHIADVKIIAVRDNLSIAQVINKTQMNMNIALAIGQKAIEKSSKFSIAVIPFEYLNSKDKVTPRAAQELMINELIKTTRFVVADSLRTEQVAKQVSSNSASGSVQFTKEAAKLLGVEYVMYGNLTDLPGFMDIQCRIHEASSGAGIAAGNVQIVAPTPVQPTPTI
jgi:TolB-like protein